MRAHGVHLVPARSAPLPGAFGRGGDLALVTFLLVVHLALLAGFVAGIGWGDAVAGYATAGVILAGRELLRELARRLWRRDESRPS